MSERSKDIEKVKLLFKYCESLLFLFLSSSITAFISVCRYLFLQNFNFPKEAKRARLFPQVIQLQLKVTISMYIHLLIFFI